ncbi:hypothetical protein FA041_28165 [Escherichia coli]|nr:hypothetical protein [Escherichia coli]EJL1875695.1 hypothetical protein [Escherichia coli]MBW9313333.1 hypothetical protein [Escherichia coli]MCV5566842.1 hypothetical protein [Escherichia coli]MDO2483006.1 hypothetical protein [Escherichia coli]MJP28854.1 hypothetical protein [Escherichia coli]
MNCNAFYFYSQAVDESGVTR